MDGRNLKGRCTDLPISRDLAVGLVAQPTPSETTAMDDDSERHDPSTASSSTERNVRDAFQNLGLTSSPGSGGESQTISLLDEIAVVSKRRVVTGSLKVRTRTELHQEIADLVLDRDIVDVTRVAVNRLVEDAPEVRTEGDTTIVPVVEERFVVVKQFFLREELHIRHRREREAIQHSVALRRQTAVVERFDSQGRIIEPGDEPATTRSDPSDRRNKTG